jgi:hypothetical protein
MSDLGGIVHYLYWSERRVRKLISDNNIRIKQPRTRGLGIKVSAPVFSMEATQQTTEAMISRHAIALEVERSLGSSAVTSLDLPSPIQFAKGIGTVVFSEFMNTGGHSLGIGSIFTCWENKGTKVGVCLFGSMGNFADYLQEGGSEFQEGWTSSAAPYIRDFLRNDCRGGIPGFSEAQLAFSALDVCLKQGMREPGNVERARLDWHRSYSSGDVQDVAEWCAQIYFDAWAHETSEYRKDWDGFHRVLIGAPLWVRTPKLGAIRIYRERKLRDLDDDAGLSPIASADNSSINEPVPSEAAAEAVRNSHDTYDQKALLLEHLPRWKAVAAWLIDLIVAVLLLGTLARSGAALLGLSDTAGWIGLVALALAYEPLTMLAFGRTIGQFVMRIEPISIRTSAAAAYGMNAARRKSGGDVKPSPRQRFHDDVE